MQGMRKQRSNKLGRGAGNLMRWMRLIMLDRVVDVVAAVDVLISLMQKRGPRSLEKEKGVNLLLLLMVVVVVVKMMVIMMMEVVI